MRTTLTLDDDVAIRVERLRLERETTLKDIVNQALRFGLERLESPPKPSRTHRTRAVTLQPRVADLDDVGEAVALAEGDGYG